MPHSNKAGHRQRLRERFISGEDVSRTDEALLELLLCYAIPQKDVQPLAQQLIAQFGGLAEVLNADFEKVCKVKGLKENSATLLKLVDWISIYYTSKPEKAEATQTSIPPKPIEEEAEQKSSKPTPKRAGKQPGAQKTDSKKAKVKKEPTTKKQPKAGEETVGAKPSTTPQRSKSELFAKAVLAEGIDLLPQLPDSESLDESRAFLQKNLPFSSFGTRRRYSSYVIRRLFPEGIADYALRNFAKQYPKSQELRDVCFYRFCQVERLMLDLIDDLVLPAIGSGQLERDKIREYIADRNPTSKSIRDSAQAIVEACSASGFIKTDRTKLTFAYRNILLPSLAFVLHSEFPEPGMYDISKLEKSQAVRTLLWNPDRLLPALYELRNQGLITKVSEIDTVRQFTTRWSLPEVVRILGT